MSRAWTKLGFVCVFVCVGVRVCGVCVCVGVERAGWMRGWAGGRAVVRTEVRTEVREVGG